MYVSSTVRFVYGGSTVRFVYGGSTVRFVYGGSTVIQQALTIWSSFVACSNASNVMGVNIRTYQNINDNKSTICLRV